MAKARSKATSIESLKSLEITLKMVDVGPLADDIQTIAEFMSRALNHDRPADIVRLAAIARALASTM